MWTYIQRTGELLFNGAHFAFGYAGADLGKNNPDLQGAKNVGPIPCGRWKITGEPFDDEHTGHFCLRLAPNTGTDTLGRSGFLIHGDGYGQYKGRASRGCIILERPIRTAIWESGDTDLLVVSEAVQPTTVEVT
jgi:hypothetical protein